MLPARTYRRTLKLGMDGHDVWALQLFLVAAGSDIATDGVFGPLTLAAVKAFQKKRALTVDGIAGLMTQRSVARLVGGPYASAQKLPANLLSSIAENESSWALGCVNWDSSGGVDSGIIQDRVEWESSPTEIAESRWVEAFGPSSLDRTARELRSRHDRFYGKPGAKTHQAAWELAVLYHNWPWGATELLNGRALSEEPEPEGEWPTKLGISSVTSYADWARWYIQKSTALVTNWTP